MRGCGVRDAGCESGPVPPSRPAPLRHELASASVIYGFGFFLLTSLFALLYVHAHRRRAALELGPLQAFDARMYAGHHLVSTSVGLFAMLFAMLAPVWLAFLSPSSFALMGPLHWAYGRWADRRRRAFAATLTPAAPLAAT